VPVLASPASLKGVLTAVEASMALAAGFRNEGVDADELPVADGGEGTTEVVAAARGGAWRTASVSDPLGRPVEAHFLVLDDGSAVLEAAEAIGLRRLAPDERDPLRASSRGLGELLLAVAGASTGEIVVGLGDTATVDGGAGAREVVGDRLSGRKLVAACDVRNPLLGPRGAARAFGPQKGATPEVVEELEGRLAAMDDLRPFVNLPGAGSAGGIGAALAALDAELVSGAALVLELVSFRAQLPGASLVVTGEGTVDQSTTEGKAPGEVIALCRDEGVRCALFGGRVEEAPEAVEVYELPGGPERAADDLVALGERLARALLGFA
jgi:glycerate 2-kinase